MRSYPNALLHQVELLTTRMGLSILSLVISSIVIFHAEGRGSPTIEEADEEIKGKAATKETEQDTMDCPQPSQNVNNQYFNPPSDPGRDIVNNPSGRATNNQPTEETGNQLPQASKDKHLEEEFTIAIEDRGQGMASSLQTETEVETKELTSHGENMVQVPQTERELNISWGVIGLSSAMLGVYLGLLGNNRQISDHMVLYEASLWLLYTSLFSGLIMLMITIIRPCTQLLSSFIYGFMSLALVSGTYAISLGIYILLPKSTFRLVIVSVLPATLFLMSMILYFKDSIITTARKFGFKPHQKFV